METEGDGDEQEEFDEGEFVAGAVYMLVTLLPSSPCLGVRVGNNGGDPRCFFVVVPRLDLTLDLHEDQRARFPL